MFSRDEHQEIVNDAVGLLGERGVTARLATAGGPDRGDGVITLAAAGHNQDFVLEVKSRTSASTVALLIDAHAHGLPPLLMSPYLTPSTLAACRRLGVSCIDTAGNMHVQFGHVLIDVEGRRSPQGARAAARPLRAFRSTGLKVLFVMLADRELVSAPMRLLAHASGSALGSVQAVLSDLEHEGYLETRHGGRTLHRSRQLFDRWVEGYGLTLARTMTLGTYSAPDPRWWRSVDDEVRAAGAQWGGETAAARLTEQLKPAVGIVYSTEIPANLLAHVRARRAEPQTANLVVRHKFWRLPDHDPALTVPSGLIYADLIASGEPRQVETARRLRETDDVLRRIDRP